MINCKLRYPSLDLAAVILFLFLYYSFFYSTRSGSVSSLCLPQTAHFVLKPYWAICIATHRTIMTLHWGLKEFKVERETVNCTTDLHDLLLCFQRHCVWMRVRNEWKLQASFKGTKWELHLWKNFQTKQIFSQTSIFRYSSFSHFIVLPPFENGNLFS